MSSVYYILGLKFEEEDLMVDKKIRGCLKDCDHPDNFKFCPECGKHPWQNVRVPIGEFEDDDWDSAIWGWNKGDCSFVGKNGEKFEAYGSYHGYEFILVGYGGCNHDEEPKRVNLTPAIYNSEKERLKSVMEPLGLWDWSKYGLWVYSTY